MEKRLCANCGHERESHYGANTWQEDEPTWCNKYKECNCKKFVLLKETTQTKQKSNKMSNEKINELKSLDQLFPKGD